MAVALECSTRLGPREIADPMLQRDGRPRRGLATEYGSGLTRYHSQILYRF